MKTIALTVILLFPIVLFAQVGIGTTAPSSASMLDVSSTSDGGTTYKGFMPPRVPNDAARDDINATSTDTGLLVFVESTGTLEIWNGINWETIYALSTQAVTLATQDFDTNINWNYNLTPASYNLNDDIWDIVNDLGSGNTSAIDLVSGNFLGCRDLNNPNGGGNFDHVISFSDVNITTITNPRISFDYDVFEFDNGDEVMYEVFYDGVSQGIVLLVDGSGNLTVQGTEIIVIPGTVNTVRINLMINQDGNTDYAGFDNFRVYGQ